MADTADGIPPGLLDGPLPFGRHFTAHMAVMRYRNDAWTDMSIQPRQSLALDPAAAVFHYAQCVFEGLKAYRHEDGRIALFRADQNAVRMASSCRIVCMPELPEGAFVRAVRALVSTDRAWVPSRQGTSLYIRPTMVASEAVLGVHPSSEYVFFVILSPVGPYFAQKAGAAAGTIRILATERHVRAARGGVGCAKTGGNYAASLRPAMEAKKLGFDQVLYLDSEQHQWCEELGAANVLFVVDGELVTPPVGDSVLPGVTRDSLLKLAPGMGLTVAERPIAIGEVVAGITSGRISEVFSCGTAAVVAPISHLGWRDEVYTVGEGAEGPVAIRLRDALVAIQRGKADDPFGWVTYLDEREPRSDEDDTEMISRPPAV